VVTDCNVVSRRADTAPQYSARSVIDDRQQGDLRVSRNRRVDTLESRRGQGWQRLGGRRSEIDTIYPLFMYGFEQCRFA
jgi:hypothetical protein